MSNLMYIIIYEYIDAQEYVYLGIKTAMIQVIKIIQL